MPVFDSSSKTIYDVEITYENDLLIGRLNRISSLKKNEEMPKRNWDNNNKLVIA